MEQKLGLRHRGGWARSSDQENAHEVYRSLDLTLFHNLQELSLENICDDLDQRKLQIAHVLEHSPNMRRLRLSLSLEKRQRGSPPGGVHRQFFDGICDIYQATGASTLRLRGLYFGGTTFPPKLGKLAKIADIAFLGEPSFWSAGSDNVLRSFWDDDRHSLFAEFKKARCPNLRYMKVLDYDLDAFPSLFDVINPSQPQQLGTTMWHGSRGLRDGWLPRPSSSSPPLRVLPLVQGLNPLHVRDALHLKLGLDLRHMHDRGIGGDGLLGDIASTDKDTIEGLKVWVHLQKSFVSWHRKTYFALLKNVIPGLAILSQTHIKDESLCCGGAETTALTRRIWGRLLFGWQSAARVFGLSERTMVETLCSNYWSSAP